MLQIKNISKSFGGIRAVRNCSFDIELGKITALIGPNGAGKTTLFDIISGLIQLDEGRIALNVGARHGVPLQELRPDQIANLGISRTFQQVRLFKNLTILDHLKLAENNEDMKLFRNIFGKCHPERSEGSSERSERFFKSTFASLTGSFIPLRGIQDDKYLEVLHQFGIEKKLDDYVSDLSYGQRKLLQMAMAFRKPHQLLLLDEPVAGVNKVVQNRIEEILLEMKKKGETMMIIDHDMSFIRRLSDRIVVMDEGKVLTEGEPETVLKDERVIEAYLGE